MNIRLFISGLALLPTLSSHAVDRPIDSNYAVAAPLTLRTTLVKEPPAVFTSAEFLRRKPKYPRDPRIKTGAILAIGGGGVTIAGMLVLVLLYPGGQNGQDNQGALYAGLGLMGAGGIMALTGGIMAGKARLESKRRYSWELVTPRRNEIGIAYNF
jgi:hypothetical protein